MNKILIISPHFPPSNLAGVHRSRLFAKYLPVFGWAPIILTVHEDYYEEASDLNLLKLLPYDLRIEKCKAYPVTKPRLIGDIGLRAFFQLRKKALELVRKEKIDFVYIPIPSFYCALIGPYLNRKTGVKYGIDYIDPWVHIFPGAHKVLSRHWWSTQLAKWLEPKAVSKASLITGVAEGYYKGVIERNPGLIKTCLFGAMPYGGDSLDHKAVEKLNIHPYLFKKNAQKIILTYAGAMLPKGYALLEEIFKSIARNRESFANIEFHFIGTGGNLNDTNSYNIKPFAEKYNLWNTIVYEYPQRIPYLDVLIHLNISDGIFILGSTEPHYTPSKVYQGVLSKKPILAVLHRDSSAVKFIKESKSGVVLSFNGEADIDKIEEYFVNKVQEYMYFQKAFNPADVCLSVFNQYSARAVTKKLVELINQSIEN